MKFHTSFHLLMLFSRTALEQNLTNEKIAKAFLNKLTHSISTIEVCYEFHFFKHFSIESLRIINPSL